jgi:molybdopterin-guanine dinucleotide biosynthesis protein A
MVAMVVDRNSGRRRDVAAYILAGGASSRMGRNKALLELEGEALVLRMERTISAAGMDATVLGRPALYEPLGLAAIPDDEPGLGPLGGIATALAHSAREWNLIVAVDLPYLTAEWLVVLADRALAAEAADAILPRSERGLEPLSAVYHRRCLEPIRQALARGVRKVTDGLAGCRVEEIAPHEWKPFAPGGLLFENINTPADYDRAAAGERK